MKPKNLSLFATSLLFATALAHSSTINWVGTTTGDWNTDTNWSNTAAPATGNVYVVDGSDKTISPPSALAPATFAGDSLTVKNGAKLRLYVVSNATSTNTYTVPNLSLDGATVSPASSNASMTLALANQVTLSNAVTAELNDGGSFTNQLTFSNGYAGDGTLDIKRSGGTGTSRIVNINGTNSTSNYSGAVSTSGNASDKPVSVNIGTTSGWGTGNLSIGQFSSVVLSADVSGSGSVTVGANGALQIGNGGTGGALNQDIPNSGTVTFSRNNTLTMGNAISGTGSVRQTGTGTTVLSGNNSYTGGSTVTAGLLSLASPNAVGNTGTLLLSGGGLQFTASNKLDYSDRIKLADAAAATFDTNGRSVTFATPFTLGDLTTAALVKAGTGSLTLSAANTYTGTTTVNAGILKLTGSLTSELTVSSGASLAGTGSTTGGITLASGASVIAGTGHVTGNGITATAVTIIPDAAVVVNGSNTLDVIGYGSGTAPAVTEFATTAYRSGIVTDDTANHKITLGFTTGARVWAGSTGTWDQGTTTAWTGGDQLFYTGDNVTFGDIAADNAVTLSGALIPSAIAVTNTNAFGYTFSGTGSIDGTAALTKSGAGTLTISNSNTYTGGTVLNGGTLTTTSPGALGTGAVAINSGSLVLNGSTLTNSITGTGNLSAIGTAQSTLSGALTGLTGTLDIATTGAGKLAVSGAGTIPSSVTINVQNGATFFTAGTASVASPINLLGSGNTENLGALRLDASSTISGDVVLAADSTIGSASGAGRITGVISESGGALTLTKQGGGTVILSGVNTYTGTTILSGGTLALAGGNNRLPATSTVAFTASSSSAFDVGNTTQDLAKLTFPPSEGASSTKTLAGTNGTLNVQAGSTNLIMDNGGASTLDTTTTYNFSGLSHFNYTTTGNISTSGIGNNRPVNVNLANNTSFTAGNLLIQSASSGGNTPDTATLSLGTNNTLHVNTISLLNLESSRDNAILKFRAGVANPTLTVRAADGTGRTEWKIGASSTVTGSVASQVGTVDLVTGVAGTSTLDALVGTLSIGGGRNNSTGTNYTFAMGGGLLDANTLVVGNRDGVPGIPNTVFSVTGGTVKAGTVTLGVIASGATGVNSTFNLNGGATLAAQTIQTGNGTGTRTFNWRAGTIKTFDANTDLIIGSALTLADSSGAHIFETATSRTITVNGAIGESSAKSSLTKTGAGILVLNGAYTYTGDTTVSEGTLQLATATLSDTAALRIADGATVQLPAGSTDTVSAFYIDTEAQVGGIWGGPDSSAPNKTDRLSGTGLLNVPKASDPNAYPNWALLKGLTEDNDGKEMDPDGDGHINFYEYAFDGDPLSAVNDGKIVAKTAGGFTTLTLPFRREAGALASDGNGLVSAEKDGVVYRIQASTDLKNWTLPVTEIPNPSPLNMPPLTTSDPETPSEWEYRTFQIPSGTSKGFIRAKVTGP